MKTRLSVGTSALCLAALGFGGCASQNEAVRTDSVTQQQRIQNNSYFDLANCFPRTLDVPRPVTQESLIGFLVTARPELNECFVDPKHRGSEATTHAVINATVDQTGVKYDVTGENLTPEGTACVQKALQAKPGLEPLPEGLAPVTGKLDFTHTVGQSPSVVMGVNEASDVIGAVRLALPGWCPCFEPWSTSAPKPLQAKLNLASASPTPTAVNFEPAADEAGTKVQACLQEKLTALSVPVKSEQLILPVNFLLIHSGVADPLPEGARPELALLQFDALRAQNAANVALALGSRANAARTYDGIVQKYKANPKAVTVADLKNRCQDMLAADDALLAAQERQLENEQKTLAFLQSQAAGNPEWAEAATAAQGQVDAAKKDIEQTRQLRAQDADACPKVKY